MIVKPISLWVYSDTGKKKKPQFAVALWSLGNLHSNHRGDGQRAEAKSQLTLPSHAAISERRLVIQGLMQL